MKTWIARRPAMRTLFEAHLVGEDSSQLRSVADDALDEVERVERLLSRFDPAAEVYRLNRDGGRRWLRIDRELFEVLATVVAFRKATDGWFEPFRSLRSDFGSASPLEFDEDRNAVRFAAEGVSIDLGAFGKGYALDAAGEVLRQGGIRDFLFSGGGSSVAASGRRTDGTPWMVRLEAPLLDWRSSQLVELGLHDISLSTSRSVFPGAPVDAVSDILDPRSGTPIVERAMCSVLHPSAAVAEVWSTALLAAGRDRLHELFERASMNEESTSRMPGPHVVYWIDDRDGAPHYETLSGEGHALADRSA